MKKFFKSLFAPAPPCPKDLEEHRHLERFQCQPWYIRLWRYRWYFQIPFNATWWWFKNLFNKQQRESFSFYWSIAIGIAQSPMQWYYTMDEVFGRLRNKYGKEEDSDDDSI